MKNKFLLTIIAVILALAFPACDDGSNSDNGGGGGGGGGSNTHTHSYSATWSKNATQHWRECSCGDKTDVANHSGDTWSRNAAQHWKECMCGYQSELANHSDNPCAACDYFAGTPAPGADLTAKLSWLETNAESDTAYLVEVDDDMTIAPQTLSYNGKTGIIIALKGASADAGRAAGGMGTERAITLTGNGTIFTIEAGVTLILMENITLSGNGTDNGVLIEVKENGKLIMKTGAKVTNGQSGLWGGGVGVWGTFTMDGGEISGNDGGSGHGGGVAVHDDGTFTMNGGIIKDNQSNFPTGGGGGGGGVLVNSGTFTMNGGVISGNETDGRGGGVSNGGTFTMNGGEISGNQARYGGGVYASGTFTMKGGEISGNTSTGEGGGVIVSSNGTFIKTAEGGVIYGTGSPKANTASQGQAVCMWYSAEINNGGYRNTTVTANERLTASNGSKGEGTWGE